MIVVIRSYKAGNSGDISYFLCSAMLTSVSVYLYSAC